MPTDRAYADAVSDLRRRYTTPQRDIVVRLSRVAALGGALLVVLGGLVLVGWLTDSELLKRVYRRWVSMKAHTALTFIGFGVALLVPMVRRARWASRIAIALGVLVALNAFVQQLEYAFGVSFGTDNLFGWDRVGPNTTHPGRMAPITVVCFLILGIALVLHHLRQESIAQVMGAVSLAIAATGVLGYLFGVRGLYRISSYTSMAANTGIGLLIASVSVMLLRTDRGPMALIAGRTLGGHLARRMALPIALVPPLIGAVAVMMISDGVLEDRMAFVLVAAATSILGAGALFLQARRLAVMDVHERALADVLRQVRETETELRETETDLRRANAELDEFAAIAAHDLRRPLTAALGYAELIEEAGAADDKRSEWAQKIIFAVDRGNRLIDDLLVYARSSREITDVLPVELTTLAEQAAEDVVGDEAQCVVERLPVVIGHRGTLRQVFNNLLANAVKYARADAPKIVVDSVRAAQPNFVVIRVADNGTGVPEEERAGLFEMFRRGSTSEGTSGSGVGLAICRRIVEHHGGTIWIEDAAGGGASFCFTLPVSLG